MRPERAAAGPGVERRLAAICDVASALSTAENVDDAMKRVLAIVGARLDISDGAVWLRDGSCLRRHASWGSATESRAGEPLPARLCERAWNSGEPVRSADALAFPIRCGSDVVGVMEYGFAAVQPLDDSSRSCLIAIAQQLGQYLARLQAEEALSATQAEHHILFDNANDALGVSVDEHFVYVNQAFAAMFGYAHPDQVVGVSIYETLPVPQQAIVREHRQRRLAGLLEPMRYDSRGRRQDGSEFLSEVRATDYWINGRMYTLAIMRDTTAERHAQDALTASISALKRANSDLEQFAYAASHDLQEPLRVIVLYSELLQRRHDDALHDDAKQLLATVTTAARRISELVKDLLSYTKAASLDAAVCSGVDTNEIMTEVGDMLRDVIKTKDAIVTSDILPKVRVHRTHVVQLFQNLISNALKYHTPGQPAVIHVSGVSTGPWTELAFRDNGIGIPPEYHDRIFGVFKRLHPQRVPGTGIGLAICKKIVDHYGGTIRVDSSPGAGAAFYVKLPASDD